MKYKKSMIILVLAIFIFGVASVCASDINDTAIVNEDTGQIGLSEDNEVDVDNLETNEEKNTLSQADNDESMSVANDSQVVGADTGSYSGLASEIGNGGNVELKHDYYSYESGDKIEISVSDSVIDGKGAVIDMAGSTDKRAFYVSAPGVTFKNLTIKNANYNDGDGGAIYFEYSGTLTNCSFTANTADENERGAVYFRGDGAVINCSFTANTAKNTGAVCFSTNGNVTNCCFTGNHATFSDGAVSFFGDGYVTNSRFTGNSAEINCGAVYLHVYGKVTNCSFTNNTAQESNAGAVYLWANGYVTNCSFTANSANKCDRGGGAVCINSGQFM